MNESDLILDPEVRERLEQVLGIEVPDPNSLEFQSLLEELQENQPDLFEDNKLVKSPAARVFTRSSPALSFAALL
jgi:hypothetical protein